MMLSCLILYLANAAPIGSDAGQSEVQTPLDVHRFKVVQRDSGPINYYRVVEQPEGTILHARYRPGLESVTLGFEIPDALRTRIRRIRWQWRVQVLPIEGNDCRGGKTDSAA